MSRPEQAPLRCETCDGAMLGTDPRNARCVRCGPPKAKLATFEELMTAGATLSFDKKWGGISLNRTEYRVFVGGAGVLFRIPHHNNRSIEDGRVVLVPIDYKKSIVDRVYWGSIERAVFGLIPTSHGNFATYLWKQIKERRMLEQARRWYDVLPPEIVKWARDVIDKHSAEDDCVDNYRVACTRNKSQMRRYRSQKSHGCCGFADWSEVGPDGQKYLLGYNYGH